jgi:hypothetical protein
MRQKQNHSHPQQSTEPLVAQPRPEPGNHDDGAALNWMVRYAVPLAGVTGATLYGVLRLAYVFFYLWLRATPEEVGYGYSQVLSDELIGAIELVVLIATLIWIVGLAASIFVSLAQRATRKYRSKAAECRLFSKLKTQKIAAWSLVIAVPIVLISLPILGWLEGEQAANGYSVRNVYLAGMIRLPVLAVQAVPAEVTWASPPGSGEPDLSRYQCLLYLGQADGTSVFYGVHSQQSLRLPAADIVITLEDTTTVPVDC